jgi:hypothetical protein
MRLNALSVLAIGTLTGCSGAEDGSRFAARQTTGVPVAAPSDAPPPVASDRPPPAVADVAASAPGAPVPSIDDSLARLAHLNVVHVDELLVGLPEAAYHCYGFCDDWKDEYDALVPAAAPRLAKFVDAAEIASEGAPECASCSERVDENLGKLRALELFRVVDLIVDRAENNPNCYSLPCPADVALANAKNAERAAKLAAIVEATKGL